MGIEGEEEKKKEESANNSKKKKIFDEKQHLAEYSASRMKGKNQKLVEFYRETDTADLIKKSDMFSGMEFYIVNVDERIANKPYLESRIVEHGGRRV
jgi:hypothetical protein